MAFLAHSMVSLRCDGIESVMQKLYTKEVLALLKRNLRNLHKYMNEPRISRYLGSVSTVPSEAASASTVKER
jgi:hypothetical protein